MKTNPNLKGFDSGRANWLLRGLIVTSLGVHLFLIMHIAGWHRPGTPVYIELDLRSIADPIERQVPRPQFSTKTEVLPADMALLKVGQEEVFQAQVVSPPSLGDFLPPDLPERFDMPEIPDVRGIDITPWQAETPEKPLPENTVVETEKNTMPPEAYLSRIAQMISAEVERLYRQKAKKRQLQGRSVVRVIIDENGGLVTADVSESSSHRILDQIALKAVAAASPFPKPAKGPLTLFIPIHFKLI